MTQDCENIEVISWKSETLPLAMNKFFQKMGYTKMIPL